MTDTIEIDDEEYEVDNNPSLGTVREVQSMQMNIITDYISEEKLTEMDSMEESEIIQAIIEDGGHDAFQDVMFDRSMLEPIQTISLACDKPFDPEDVEEMGAQDFKKAREDAEDALGGTADDFFEDLGIGTSLTEEQMRQQV